MKISFVILIAVSLVAPAQAATLFADEFDENALNTELWRLPTGAGTFFGRTQIKPPEFDGHDLRPVVSGGTIKLQLDTYNASAITPGDSFWGHEIQTRQLFAPGDSGIAIKSRIRILTPTAGGLVGGFFTFGLNFPVRDETDTELLTNDIGAEHLFTNVFDNDDFSQPGDFAHLTVSGLDLTQWNTYEMRWLTDRVQWFVNGVMVREELGTVPDDPMEVRINLWAPDQSFYQAYDPSLQPAASPADNVEYELEVDYVHVLTLGDRSDLRAAVLPASRSVQVGSAATAYATIINAGDSTATSCSIAPLTSVPAQFSYQTTDPATNALTGTPNTPVGIAEGALQTYLLAFTPTVEFGTDVQLSYDCTNSSPAPVIWGVNTLYLSASGTPVSDIVALSATPTGDGIVNLPGNLSANAFAVA